MPITWLTSSVNAPGGLPTRVANALHEQSTRVDLETLFLEKNFRKVVEDKVNSIKYGSRFIRILRYIRISITLSL